MNFANVKEWRIPEGNVTRVTDSQNRVIWEQKLDFDYLKNIVDNADKTVPSTLSGYNVVKNISGADSAFIISTKMSSFDPYTFEVCDHDGNVTTLTFDENHRQFRINVKANECLGLQPQDILSRGGTLFGVTPVTQVRGTDFYVLIGSSYRTDNNKIAYTCQGDTMLLDASSFSYSNSGTSTVTTDDATKNGTFSGLFASCRNLIYPPRLTSVNYRLGYEYFETFSGCTNLARIMPNSIWVTTNGGRNRLMCYRTYAYCEHIVDASNAIVFGSSTNPINNYANTTYLSNHELYSTFQEMFSGCIRLKYAKFALPTPQVSTSVTSNTSTCGNAFSYMFDGCRNLIEPPKIEIRDATTGYVRPVYGDYHGIFNECYNLQKLVIQGSILIPSVEYGYLYDETTHTWSWTWEPGTRTAFLNWLTIGANPYYGIDPDAKPDNQTGMLYRSSGVHTQSGNPEDGMFPSGWSSTLDPWY